MTTVRIVTDSACDLTADQANALGVEIVPLTIRFGDVELVDRVDLSVEDFYVRLTSSPTLPETAAPSPGAFETVFRKLAGDGAKAIVCINLSSKLSATMQAAQNAARAVADEIDVRVVDSRSVTLGLGSQVLAAAEAARSGAPVDAIVELVEGLATRTRVFGTLDTLEYLKKGGRIGQAQALLGTMLSFKPGIEVRDGEVTEAGKPRTRKKALRWLASKVLDEPRVENLWILHAMAGDIDDFLALLVDRFPRQQVQVGLVGAVIGTHAGPGVIGVTYQVSAPVTT